MGLISSFTRFIITLILFIVGLFVSLTLAPQLMTSLAALPGSFTLGSGTSAFQYPVLVSLVGGLLLTFIVNILAFPFRRRAE